MSAAAATRCLLLDGDQRILKVKEAGTRSARLIGVRVMEELVIQQIQRRLVNWRRDLLRPSNEYMRHVYFAAVL